MLASRRQFIRNIATLATGLTLAPNLLAKEMFKKHFFEISLAEWSLHKSLFGNKMTNLDFPVIAKQKFDISAVEYVNQFFKDKAKDINYLNQLLQRCKDHGVKNHLIMIDGEGGLGDTDAQKRTQAVENHYKWVDAAKHLGCTTIRVNAYGEGSSEEVQKAAIEGLSKLAEYSEQANINIIVENHGGFSSNGQWLATVMNAVNKKNVGTLPDFGNFCVKRGGGDLHSGKCIEEYDRYKGVQEMMPFAKGVSAKAYDFDANGNCIETDYTRMMKIIMASGFNGYIGIEYEGEKLSEEEGIRKTKALLEKVATAIGYNHKKV